jgi:hypothetical protein
MSEMAVRQAAAAMAEMRLAHEMRALRDAELLGSYGPSLSLRKGTITARDPASLTVTVLFAAADTSDFPGVPIPGIRLADTVYPIVGASCFVAWNGPEPVVLYTVGSPAGRARARRTIVASWGSGTGTALGFSTADDDTDSLWSASQTTRVYARWPGLWRADGMLWWAPLATDGYREVALYWTDGTSTLMVDRQRQLQPHPAIHHSLNVGDQIVVPNGNGWFELRPEHNSASTLTISATNVEPHLSVAWKGP